MTVDYQALANGVGANVESQAQYLTDLGPGGSLQNGYQPGVAQSRQVNKTLRQSSVMTAAMANFVADVLGVDVLDDGNVAALNALIKSAVLNQGWSTGDVKLTFKTAADVGWTMCNDGTIGNGASGATYANDNAKALFLLLWNNVIDAWAPVVTGRGGSALADWNANKKITLTKMLGRALAISGAGVGLTARALGQNLGAEDSIVPLHNHGATSGQSADHTHALASVGNPGGNYQGGGNTAFFAASSTGGASNDHTHNISNAGVSPTGGNMPPESFLNAMIKL